MAMAVGRGVDVRIAPASKTPTKVWSPIPLIAMVGFATLMFNFVGINLFGSGLHSYSGLD